MGPVAKKESYFHEGNTWVGLAREDLSVALQRVVRAARDEHKIKPHMSEEEHYNQMVANALGKSEIVFDPAFLNKKE